jgi:hypothetical protein
MVMSGGAGRGKGFDGAMNFPSWFWFGMAGAAKAGDGKAVKGPAWQGKAWCLGCRGEGRKIILSK